MPTFLYRARGDILIDPSDVQTRFDNIPVAEKKLHWIEGTTPDGTGTWIPAPPTAHAARFAQYL